MTPREKAVITAIIKALHVQRDRLGRLESDLAQQDMDALAMSVGIPHGGLDRVDKASMMLQAICGYEVVSILDGDLAFDKPRFVSSPKLISEPTSTSKPQMGSASRPSRKPHRNSAPR